ncbi:Uncharacterised protein [Mycolicibacterium phlei]|uniref:hypothetical protein n=1 Tax=Mycobacteroides chelonae TaxID=1774 RepID=UPI000618BDED|nr:hypothetical protein [Mycobacteroides chelonae]VEG15774.1 Uncharacterised protein [Mycolicibacterium phlei]AKC38470.1 hypothetical protein GR01_07685 [Mycobacteroides chelonae]ANA97707.1 hypothetical protein BB28_08155 [Mycobacteroides chelonae CCUG 47445]OLT75171.1 hypothetical protein BKG56_15470 [Mycobacteroides chelonae]ORV12820.1 hypothetical protein AWB96_15710 [Mycobacteroides chelonae]
MGKPALRADTDKLRSLASELSYRANNINNIDAAASVREAESAMPGSKFAAAVARLGDPNGRAFKSIGGQITRMQHAAWDTSLDYETQEQAFAAQLHDYGNGR